MCEKDRREGMKVRKTEREKNREREREIEWEWEWAPGRKEHCVRWVKKNILFDDADWQMIKITLKPFEIHQQYAINLWHLCFFQFNFYFFLNFITFIFNFKNKNFIPSTIRWNVDDRFFYFFSYPVFHAFVPTLIFYFYLVWFLVFFYSNFILLYDISYF